MDLGMFQAGQSATIGIATVDAEGNPVAPNAAPQATITPPSGGAIAAKLAMSDGSSTAFSLPIFIGADIALGTYTVAYSYVAGGYSGSGSDTFEVIAGGDPGGRVISMRAYVRPEATYVVAQVSGGIVLQGRNPKLKG